MVSIDHHRFLEDFHLPSPFAHRSACRPSSTYRELPPTITSCSVISTHLNQLGFQIRFLSQTALSTPFYSSIFDGNQSIAPYAGQRCCQIGYTNRNTCDIYDDVVSHRRSHLPVTVCTSNHLVSFTQSVCGHATARLCPSSPPAQPSSKPLNACDPSTYSTPRSPYCMSPAASSALVCTKYRVMLFTKLARHTGPHKPHVSRRTDATPQFLSVTCSVTATIAAALITAVKVIRCLRLVVAARFSLYDLENEIPLHKPFASPGRHHRHMCTAC